MYSKRTQGKGGAVLDSDVIVYTQREALFGETLLIFFLAIYRGALQNKKGGGFNN